MRILLLHSDAVAGIALKRELIAMGLVIDWLQDGRMGLEAVATTGYDAVLLDLVLDGIAGLDVLSAMRTAEDTTPVLILTACNSRSHRVESLDLGADDYIVTPLDMAELGARIRAVVRRRAGHACAKISHGDLSVDLTKHIVSYGGSTIALSAREFALIRALAERPGVILSRHQLEEKLYGWGDEVTSNAIDFIIHSIRRKFGKDIIRNVRGVGWNIGGKRS